jgi:hypothetical protein
MITYNCIKNPSDENLFFAKYLVPFRDRALGNK